MHVQVQLTRFAQNERRQLSTGEDDDVPDTNHEGVQQHCFAAPSRARAAGAAQWATGSKWLHSTPASSPSATRDTPAVPHFFTRAEWFAVLGGVERGEFRPA
jgi:hypothetical protein